jgi:hypothetical protein
MLNRMSLPVIYMTQTVIDMTSAQHMALSQARRSPVPASVRLSPGYSAYLRAQRQTICQEAMNLDGLK